MIGGLFFNLAFCLLDYPYYSTFQYFFIVSVPFLMYQFTFMLVITIVIVNNGYFGYFHILAIVDKAIVNICVQIFVPVYIFFFVGYKRKSRIVESYGYSVFTSVRNCQFSKHGYTFFCIPLIYWWRSCKMVKL